MKYYKDINNNVYAYEADGSQDHLIGDKVAMTSDEIETHLNPSITPEQLMQQSKSAVYNLLDQTAQQYDYRNFAEVSQFVNSNVWKTEANGLLVWQDAVWTKAYELLTSPITSIDDFVVQLPKYVPTSGS
jgi:vancomycin resistance protein YoaR